MSGGLQTDSELHPRTGGQPKDGDAPDTWDRVWPDAGPARESLTAPNDVHCILGKVAGRGDVGRLLNGPHRLRATPSQVSDTVGGAGRVAESCS
jgi:hypothetical protein